MDRRRITRIALTLVALLTFVGASGCGATAGEGRTVPPSTSPK